MLNENIQYNVDKLKESFLNLFHQEDDELYHNVVSVLRQVY